MYLVYSSIGISKPERKTPKSVMIQTAGNIQVSRVRNASLGPPILKPTAVKVWVDAGPGSIWQYEFKNINRSFIFRLISDRSIIFYDFSTQIHHINSLNIINL